MVALRAWSFTFFLVIVGQTLAAEEPAPATKGTRTGSQAMLIHVDRDRLTVKLKEAPLKTALDEIGRRTGIEITIQGSLTKNISMEFEDLPLEEGLQRLLKGYGWMLISDRQGGHTLEKVFVVPIDEGARFGRPQGASPPKRGQEAKEPPPDQSVRMAAALANKKEVKHFFDTILHNPDHMAQMNALRDVANSISVEEAELAIRMLRDENVKLPEWEAGLAPLSDVMSSEERESIISSLQNRSSREYMVEMLEKVYLYKTLVEAGTR